MHELGIVFHIIDRIKRFKEENNLKEVSKIVLEVGEASSVIPKYLMDCYPAAVNNTEFEKTALEINTITAVARCSCMAEFVVSDHNGICPACNEKNFILISGKEFNIKEIIAN